MRIWMNIARNQLRVMPSSSLSEVERTQWIQAWTQRKTHRRLLAHSHPKPRKPVTPRAAPPSKKQAITTEEPSARKTTTQPAQKQKKKAAQPTITAAIPPTPKKEPQPKEAAIPAKPEQQQPKKPPDIVATTTVKPAPIAETPPPAPSIPTGEVVLSDDYLLVLQLSIGNTLYEEFLEGYESDHGANYVPLGLITELLDLAVDIDTEEKLADGWVIDQENTFFLDLKNHTIELKGEKQSYPKHIAIMQDEDIFVDTTYLSTWLPIKFNVNKRSMVLEMEPEVLLPMQARDKRQQRWDKVNQARSRKKPTYKEVKSERKWIDWPFIDVTLNQSYDHNAEEPIAGNYSFRAGNDLLGMNASSFISGDDKDLNSARFSLSETSHDKTLFGFMGASHFEIGDINTPNVPLAAPSGLGRGFHLTSHDQNYRSQFDVTEFVGDATPGWEVELYRNNALLGFQTVAQNGRYSFRNIPVLFGNNTFRLIFYGPQGEIEEKVERVLTDNTLLPKGQMAYNLSFDQKERTLAGIDDKQQQYLHPDSIRSIATVDYGLTDDFTLSAGGVQIPLDDGIHSYGTGSIRTTLVPGFLLSQDFSYDLKNGGWASRWLMLTSIKDTSLKLNHTHYSDFISEDLETLGSLPSSVSEFDVNTTIPFISGASTGLNLKYETFTTDLTRTTLRHQVSGSWMGIGVTQQVNMTQNETGANTTRQTRGNLSLHGTLWQSAIRMSTDYDLEERDIEIINMSVQRRLTEKLVSQWNLTKELRNDYRTSISTALNWDRPNYKLGVRINADTNVELFLGTNMSFGIGREPRSGSWKMDARSVSEGGAVSARAFLDKNYNGIKDEDEEWMKEGKFKFGKRRIEGDDEGTGFGMGNAPLNAMNVVFDESSLHDPFWVALEKGYTILPKPGHTTYVDFPVITVTEIDGIVSFMQGGEEEPFAKGKVQLLDQEGNILQETRTEFDGFYLFERVRAGTYTIRIKPEILDTIGRYVEPLSITIEDLDDVYSGYDILLKNTLESEKNEEPS